ncbi:uncharacterized protein LOC133779692 [Humulus lupulus]|uniref:uncharacterized protein LOC133779692 n=1 Tax=Humulus lupulus TaxID=3486 RepID=UPI002B40B16F|nr:uncharacterized protein LOC133779692 [Humulus lupulus]
MEEVLGIEPLEFTDDDEGAEEHCDDPGLQDVFQAPLSPKSSLKVIQQQDDIRSDFVAFLEATQKCSTALSKGLSTTPPVLRSGSVVRNLETSFPKSEQANKIKITMEDIEEEISYWNSSIVCYVLGANSPLSVLEGFARRLWKDKVDKDPNTNFKKEDIRTVPIWVQLDDLELKYWGQKSLFKILGQVGKPLMVDAVTKERDKLSYPRVLIEVCLQQDFPSCIEFEDEFCFNVTEGVTYEWKPIMCGHCKGMGHATNDCRRKEGRKQQWIVKEEIKKPEREKKTEAVKSTVDEFQSITKGWRVKAKESMACPSTMNSFQALSDPSASTSAVTGENQNESTTQEDLKLTKAGLVGLLETRVKAPKLGALYVHMFSGWCFTTNSAWHKGGRIIVAWNPLRFNVSILSCSNQLIHLFVATVDNKHRFFTTFVYGFNDEEGRKSLWKSLQELARAEPWVVLGDFNDILNRDERIGDRVRHNSNNDFMNCVSYCQLEDVKFSGNFFTWSNKQQGSDRIYSKIDRVLANQAWVDSFTIAEAIFLNEGIFDHTPAILTVHSDIPSGKNPFKYFRMWSSHPQYHQEVSRVWHQTVKGTKMFQVVTKLKDLKAIFKDLNKLGFSAIHMADLQAREKLNECQNKLHRDPLNVDLQYQELEARRHYAGVHKDYCSFLSQKSKVTWVKEGDKNSAIFHSSIKERRCQNRIYSITNAEGNRVEDPVGVTEAFLSYYQSLLGTQMENRQPVKTSIRAQGPVISRQQADLLLADFSKDDIKNAVFSIPGIKAPGHLLKELNSTVITLIPKCKCPNTDLIRHYGSKSIRPNCMIKLDLQKAYDTMEWGFLEEMLHAFQFPAKFINLIMNCVTTPRYSLMFNGSMHGFFVAKRGLRQGDPMSPLLFVLGMEYFSRIMQKVGEKEDFQFHERCSDLKLNHLSFANDVLLFCKGYFKSIYLMLQGLKFLSNSSGLNSNIKKTAIYCSGMSEEEIRRVLDVSGFSRNDISFKYLGIPICAKRISAAECKILVEKMTTRIKTWSSRNLSFAGRSVLINSVLLSIHAYWSQIMILPKKLVSEIESICRSFLWKGQSNMIGSGSVAWKKLCKPKKAGGIGFMSI